MFFCNLVTYLTENEVMHLKASPSSLVRKQQGMFWDYPKRLSWQFVGYFTVANKKQCVFLYCNSCWDEVLGAMPKFPPKGLSMQEELSAKNSQKTYIKACNKWGRPNQWTGRAQASTPGICTYLIFGCADVQICNMHLECAYQWSLDYVAFCTGPSMQKVPPWRWELFAYYSDIC